MSHYRDKETLIHLLKGCLGTGILAMPNAFGNAGLALGTVATVLIGILCTYCLHVLVGITMIELSCYAISITRVVPETGASPWRSCGPLLEKSWFRYLCKSSLERILVQAVGILLVKVPKPLFLILTSKHPKNHSSYSQTLKYLQLIPLKNTCQNIPRTTNIKVTR